MNPLLKAVILFFSGVGVFVIGYLTQNSTVLGISALIGLTIAFAGFMSYAMSILNEPELDSVRQ